MEWYALRLKSQHEQNVANCLSFKGYEVFLPSYRTARRWSDRVTYGTLPLFPGYAFCRLDLAARTAPVVTTPGVIRILGIGSKPQPVDTAGITAIQTIAASRLPIAPWPYLRQGTRVCISRGPLGGVEGLVDSVRPERLVVSITLLSRSMMVEVDPAWLTASPANSTTLKREATPANVLRQHLSA
jgi:transcription antitermination factor NusG